MCSIRSRCASSSCATSWGFRSRKPRRLSRSRHAPSSATRRWPRRGSSASSGFPMPIDPDRYGRLRELFHGMVEHAPSERPRLLAELPESDAHLVAELKSLLDAHDSAGEFVAEGLAAHQRVLGKEVGAKQV